MRLFCFGSVIQGKLMFEDLFYLKPQLHIHDFGHGRATTHAELSSRDASA